MLSRTADHLFWMARYIERAENTARMLDANYRMSLLPQSEEYATSSWHAMLTISELSEVYTAQHPHMTSRDVIAFMSRDARNPSSILSCLYAARENARAVRFEMTTELWEAINTTWLECQRMLEEGILERDPGEFLEWVKFRSHLSRGVELGTMARDAAFYFIRLGTFIERADNTARILDMKFQMREQQPGEGVYSLDYYHWVAVLNSVSAFEAYRKVYRDVITPGRVADLLISHRDWPRSLVANLEAIVHVIARLHIAGAAQTGHFAGQLRAELRDTHISNILHDGLHAWLTRFLARINELATRASQDFMMPTAQQRAPAN